VSQSAVDRHGCRVNRYAFPSLLFSLDRHNSPRLPCLRFEQRAHAVHIAKQPQSSTFLPERQQKTFLHILFTGMEDEAE
jgi:hypothetical protein